MSSSCSELLKFWVKFCVLHEPSSVNCHENDHILNLCTKKENAGFIWLKDCWSIWTKWQEEERKGRTVCIRSLQQQRDITALLYTVYTQAQSTHPYTHKHTLRKSMQAFINHFLFPGVLSGESEKKHDSVRTNRTLLQNPRPVSLPTIWSRITEESWTVSTH